MTALQTPVATLDLEAAIGRRIDAAGGPQADVKLLRAAWPEWPIVPTNISFRSLPPEDVPTTCDNCGAALSMERDGGVRRDSDPFIIADIGRNAITKAPYLADTHVCRQCAWSVEESRARMRRKRAFARRRRA
jgi:hypothetical protein